MANKNIDKKQKKNLLNNSSFDNYKEYEYIIDRLTYVRTEFNITQGEIAEKLKITQAGISVVERKLSFGFIIFKLLMFFVENHHLNPNWVLIKDNKEISKFTNLDEFAFSKKNTIHLKMIKDYQKFNAKVIALAKESGIILNQIEQL